MVCILFVDKCWLLNARDNAVKRYVMASTLPLINVLVFNVVHERSI